MNPFEREDDEETQEVREDNWWLAGTIERALDRSATDRATDGASGETDNCAAPTAPQAETGFGVGSFGGDPNF